MDNKVIKEFIESVENEIHTKVHLSEKGKELTDLIFQLIYSRIPKEE